MATPEASRPLDFIRQIVADDLHHDPLSPGA
jgi:hypothetical protein